MNMLDFPIRENEIEAAIEERAEDEITNCDLRWRQWFADNVDASEMARYVSLAISGGYTLAMRDRWERDYTEYRSATASDTERDEIIDRLNNRETA